MKINIPRIVIAGTHSNVGKTTIICALARYFNKKGIRTKVFKCGPDYLDPTYHQRASGSSSVNLDSWMMGTNSVLSTFYNASKDYDLALIEGVMGLYDGLSPTNEAGSTAEISKILGAPVVLVCDASGMARSIAALVNGFKGFDKELHFGGVLCNRVGSAGHLDLLKRAIQETTVFGGVTKGNMHFPSRHLGLTTASKEMISEEVFDYWENKISEHVDTNALLDLAKEAKEKEAPVALSQNEQKKCVIAYAHDDAFHFYYEENFNLLKNMGAELIPFSPLKDSKLPENIDGILIGGGYPEVHAKELSENKSMIEDIKKFKGPIYGECGGLMYLSEGIITLDNKTYPMLGLLKGQAKMENKLQALGYVEVELKDSTIIGPKGLRFRGHQFRYSTLESAQENPLVFSLRKRRNKAVSKEGYKNDRILGSYVHAHFGSNHLLAKHFIESCLGEYGH
ncbi:MAG: cobyrinate a,c-diamide synthase [Bdellovibrionales bacterium]|nr:cobyrinate a,c-diamide synthase [Bdellovibrionales bacterium]